VHHFSDEVWSLKEPRLATVEFLEIENVVPPKLTFLYRVFAHPVLVTTDETMSFQPFGMAAA